MSKGYLLTLLWLMACSDQARTTCLTARSQGRLVPAPGGESAWALHGDKVRKVSLDGLDSGCEQDVPGGAGAALHPVDNIIWIVARKQVWRMTPCEIPREQALEQGHFEHIEKSLALDASTLLLFGRLTNASGETQNTILRVAHYPTSESEGAASKGSKLREIFIKSLIKGVDPRTGEETLDVSIADWIKIAPTEWYKSTDGKAIWMSVEVPRMRSAGVDTVCRVMIRDLLRPENGDEAPLCSGYTFGARVTSLSSTSSSDAIWVGTENGAFYWSDVYAGDELRLNKPEHFSIGAILSITRDSLQHDMAWALTEKGMLYRLRKGQKPEQIKSFPAGDYKKIFGWNGTLLLFSTGGVDECTGCAKETAPFAQGSFDEAYPTTGTSLWLSGRESTFCSGASKRWNWWLLMWLFLAVSAVGAALVLLSRRGPEPQDNRDPPTEPPLLSLDDVWYELRLTEQDKDQVVRAMLACRAMSDQDQRQQVVDSLRIEIRGRINHSNVAISHIRSIINTCDEFPGALKELRDALHRMEGNTRHMRALDRLLEKITRRPRAGR